MTKTLLAAILTIAAAGIVAASPQTPAQLRDPWATSGADEGLGLKGDKTRRVRSIRAEMPLTETADSRLRVLTNIEIERDVRESLRPL